MKSLAFANYTDMPITLLGFILFITVFLSVLWWTGLKINKEKYKYLASELLKDEESR